MVMYRQCAEKRDKKLKRQLQESNYKLGLSMSLEDAMERASQLQASITSLVRRMILASGMEGMEGFRWRWSLHVRLEDSREGLESLNQGIEKMKKEVTQEVI